MRIKSRWFGWALALGGVALLPVGMTLAVLLALARGEPAPPSPRVVAGWPSGPMEVRVAFDRPVDPVVAAHAVGHVIRFGGPAQAALGSGRPGGDGGSIRIVAARLLDSGRTLLLVTDPHPRSAVYSLTIAEIKAPGDPKLGRSEVVQYALAGVDASWTAAGAEQPTWAGWWPDTDPTVVRAMLTGSADHDRLWPLLAKPGKLVLRSFVTLPAGKTRSVVDSDATFEATLGSESSRSDAGGHATLDTETTGEPIELGLTLTTPPIKPDLNLHWSFALTGPPAQTPRALPHAAFELPWAPPPLPPAVAPTIPPGLATGGDPARGAIVFSSEAAKCANCHQVRGLGGQVGPNLSNLAQTSRAWIYQNIIEPSASIHPDFLAYTVAMKDGRISMGIVRAEGPDALRVGDIDAKFTTFPRAEVEEIRPSTSSIMPVGLLGAIGEEQTRDLLAFLTSPDQAPVPQPVKAP